ncbi:hypothetical protein LJ754_01705 [Arthrobacter sp. zg-Y40]|uniref:hypothetical protein n=1 Tax=Arthrobacter sp. zg-Y40 TaxID=2886939 RepID=UPI001D1478F4|nr:hypothetical protein [Arthrobacter sp. zg-Y40]MCC3277878.1 hypothetical protein [Arthrobacter sp. zg-Y40]
MLSASALELLAAMVSRAAVERRRRRLQPAAVAELQDADLLTADAFLTARGHRLAGPWRRADRRLALCSRNYGSSTRLDIWTGEREALLLTGTDVLTGPDLLSGPRASSGNEQLSLLPLGSLTPVLARRAASPHAGPGTAAAPGEHQVLVLDAREYEDRLNGGRLPSPEGAGAEIRDMLETDWTEWTLADQSSGQGFTWISAAGAGIWAAQSLPGAGTALEAIASSTLQDILMCLIYALPEQLGSALPASRGRGGRKQQQRGQGR